MKGSSTKAAARINISACGDEHINDFGFASMVQKCIT